MKNFFSVIFVFCVFFYVSNALAFYCDGKIVDEKDFMVEVAAKCGNPDGRASWTKYRQKAITQLVPAGYHYPAIKTNAVTAADEYEQWVYNFGPHRFVQVLTFKNGVLTKIENDGYGY